MELDRPLIKMEPEEVRQHLQDGNITEDQALDYTVQHQLSSGFLNMDPEDVKLGAERGLISEKQVNQYADWHERGRLNNYTRDTFRGVTWGIRHGLEEMSQSANELQSYVLNKIGVEQQDIDKANTMMKPPSPVDVAAKAGTWATDKVETPASRYGGLVEGFAQGATGYAAGAVAAAFVPEAAIPAFVAKAPKLWKFISSAAKGAVGDAFAFDPHDPHLADALDQLGILPEFMEFAKASPNDTTAEGRWKNVLDGLAVGGAMEPIGWVVGKMGKYAKSKIWSQAGGKPDVAQAAVKNALGFTMPKSVDVHAPATMEHADLILDSLAAAKKSDFADAKGSPIFHIQPAEWNAWSMSVTKEMDGKPRILEQTPYNEQMLAKHRLQQLVDEGHTPAQIAETWFNGGREATPKPIPTAEVKLPKVSGEMKGLGKEYVETIKAGLAGNETRGIKDPYAAQSAVNRNGARAQGKYQIMPATWKDWSTQMTKEKTGVGEVLAKTPENQELVTSWRIEKWLEQGHSPAEIASMWYSGRPNYQSLKGVTDVYGRLDVPGYVQSFLKNFDQALENGPHRSYAERMLRNASEMSGGKINQDHVSQVMKLGDAMADSFRERTGKSTQEWWQMSLGDIRLGGKPEDALQALYQPGYHGSPYQFTEFSTDYAGSGHGGASVGAGAYFTSEPKFAQYYRDGLVDQKLADVKPTITRGLNDLDPTNGYAIKDRMLANVSVAGDNGTLFKKTISELNPEGIQLGKDGQVMYEGRLLDDHLRENTGAVYKAEIPDDNALMKWDKPISENGVVRGNIMKVAEKYGLDVPNGLNNITGREFYRALMAKAEEMGIPASRSDSWVSRVLDENGVAGHRFSEPNARFVEGIEGAVDNFVVYGDKSVKSLETLYQGERGAVQFTKDGMAVLHLFNNADASTIVHELGHIMRRQLEKFDKPGLAAIEKHFGVTNGKWTVDAEEAFSKSFESYVMTGKAPSARLLSPFETIKQAMLDVYRGVRDMRIPVHDDVKELFSKMLTTERERGKPLISTTAEQGLELVTAVKKIADGSAKVTAKDLKEGGAFNLSKFANVQDVFDSVQAIFNHDEETLKQFTRGTVSLTQSADRGHKLAERMTKNLNMPLEQVRTLYTGVKNLDARLNGHMDVLESWADAVRQLAKEAVTEEDDALLYMHMVNLREYSMLLKGAQTEIARGLGSLRNNRLGTIDMARLNPHELEAMMKDSAKFKKLKKSVAGLDVTGLLSYSRKMGEHKVMEGLLEMRQGSLLNIITSSVKNITGNTVAMTLEAINKTASTMAVGVKELLTTGETQRFKQALAYTAAHYEGFKDVLKLNSTGRAAVWEILTSHGEKRLTKLTTFLDDPSNGNFWKALLTGNSQLIPELNDAKWGTGGGAVPTWALGPVFRLPFKALAAEDEMFKAMAYRAELTFQAYENAMKLGHKGDAANQFVRDFLDAPTGTAHLDALQAEAHREAVKYAQDLTFSTNLEGAPKKLNEMFNGSALGLATKAIFMPFTKITFNVLKFAKQRSVLDMIPLSGVKPDWSALKAGGVDRQVAVKDFFNSLGTRFYRDLAEGGVKRAEAVTRIITGTALVGLGAQLYSEGRLTGQAPKKQKDAWRNAGIQENSMRVGNEWVDYNSIQPVSTFLRVGADLAKLWESKDLPEDQRDDLFTGAVMILANQVSDAYMKSIGDMVKMWSDPESMNLKKLMNKQAKSWAPFSSMGEMRQRVMDTDVREVSPDLDMWNSLVSAYYNDVIPKQYHSVYGTPKEQESRVALTLNRRTSDDPIMLELAKVGANITKPGRTITVKGATVELNDEQYAQYQQIISELPVKEALAKVINSPSYQKAQDDGKKAAALQRVVSHVRTAAKNQLLKGNPELTGKLKDKILKTSEAVAGLTLNENPDTQFYHWMEYMKEEGE